MCPAIPEPSGVIIAAGPHGTDLPIEQFRIELLRPGGIAAFDFKVHHRSSHLSGLLGKQRRRRVCHKKTTNDTSVLETHARLTRNTPSLRTRAPKSYCEAALLQVKSPHWIFKHPFEFCGNPGR